MTNSGLQCDCCVEVQSSSGALIQPEPSRPGSYSSFGNGLFEFTSSESARQTWGPQRRSLVVGVEPTGNDDLPKHFHQTGYFRNCSEWVCFHCTLQSICLRACAPQCDECAQRFRRI